MIYLVGTLEGMAHDKFGPYLKIGYSSENIRQRVADLQTGNPYQLHLFGTLPGDLEAERALHDRWQHLHYRGEWFRRWIAARQYKNRPLEERILDSNQRRRECLTDEQKHLRVLIAEFVNGHCSGLSRRETARAVMARFPDEGRSLSTVEHNLDVGNYEKALREALGWT